MKIQTSFHIALLSFFLLQASSFSGNHLCQDDDALALLQFKEMFNVSNYASIVCEYYDPYSYPKTESWNASADCCSWDGVTCHHITGRVIGLDLSCSRLEGIIHPNSSLFRLSLLQHLNLAFNDFSDSTISREFGSLTSLTHFNLSYSYFRGEIASEISHLSRLVSLDLSSSVYGGCYMGPSNFQMMLQNITHLRELSLSLVNISSELPMNLSSSMTHLDLTDTELYGNVPSIVFHLPNMQVLLLSWNHELSGSLPKFNCSISGSLRVLGLSLTNISGVLPHSIGCSKSLNSLDLSSTNISGVLPDSIGCLKSLNSLDLGSCQFSGAIPESIGNLTQLTQLDLSDNHFNGQLPDCFANLNNLRVLLLSKNILVGKFPISLLNLTHLEGLDLSNNLLTGQIGDFTSNLLESIYLENNQLTGLIPRSIFSLPNLSYLLLSANNFHGIEPNMFVDSNKLQNYSSDGKVPLNTTKNFNFSLSHLRFLDLSSCGIEEFPDFLINSPGLMQLDLSNNNIHGKVPSWLMSLDNLNYLDMSSNLLIGQLPSSICNSSSLQILDLSANNLISTIPQCLGNLSQQLYILDLGNNGLLGTIPTTYSNGCQLEVLILNNNKLEGPLPRSLAYCTRLELLDIGNNKMDDKFPMWLETLTFLRVLILKSNRFHGAIGNSKTESPFPELRIIDVSYNELTGVLPAQLLMHFKNMMLRNDDNQMQDLYMKIYGTGIDNYYVHSVSLVLKGVDYNLERVLTTRVVLDFSSNKFEGEIPELIGNLHSLQILNLSHNNLSGHIPRTIGNLNMLESLDLSWNQLDGTIPVELLNLAFLEFLNLSENHLVGPIPRGRHFDTFENNSFQGNLGLCGLPLSKECGSTGAAPPSTPLEFEQENDSEFFDGFTWKSVLLGYGCGLVLGIAIGSLMFSTGKPRWFIRFVDGTFKLRKRPRKWIHMRT